MSTPTRPNVGGWFSKDRDGQTIVRERTCECGARYTQMLLSERFMSIVQQRGSHAVDATMNVIPDMFVPVLCPACESRALGAAPVEVTYNAGFLRRRLEDRERFARVMGQLCAAYNKPMDDETSQIFWRALERSCTDDEFEKGVLEAIRSERKWPTPSVIAHYARAA